MAGRRTTALLPFASVVLLLRGEAWGAWWGVVAVAVVAVVAVPVAVVQSRGLFLRILRMMVVLMGYIPETCDPPFMGIVFTYWEVFSDYRMLLFPERRSSTPE